NAVAPALQILLGGGVLGNGEAVFAQKVIKIPSRRGPEGLRRILDDYERGKETGELFHQYYQRRGKKYFYTLLKELADQSNLQPEEFIDWGKADDFVPAIGVGECAGVVIDLVQTLLFESEEKLDWAGTALKEGRYADSIYHSYTALVNTAKALLTGKGITTNTQASIIRQFDEAFVESGEFPLSESFAKLVYQMRTQAPTHSFATAYLAAAESFFARANDPQKVLEQR
ncbi:MAG: HEPN domain-containing protein, partial [Bacteroidota bacterium]